MLYEEVRKAHRFPFSAHFLRNCELNGKYSTACSVLVIKGGIENNLFPRVGTETTTIMFTVVGVPLSHYYLAVIYLISNLLLIIISHP